MSVLVDTPIWSLALRRRRGSLAPEQESLLHGWESLVRDKRILMIGPVRQEVLSGVRDPRQYRRLRSLLRAFVDDPLTTDDFEAAAACSNRCRSRGIAGSAVDFLLCAVALQRRAAIFTIDASFRSYATCLAIRLHQPEP